MADRVQNELIDAIADETTHLRAELNAVKAELVAMRQDLRHIVFASGKVADSARSKCLLEDDLSAPPCN